MGGRRQYSWCTDRVEWLDRVQTLKRKWQCLLRAVLGAQVLAVLRVWGRGGVLGACCAGALWGGVTDNVTGTSSGASI